MGSYETVPDVAMPPEPPARHDLLVSAVRPLISNFLETIDYIPPQEPDKSALKTLMLEYASASGVPYKEDRHARQCFVTGLSVAGVRTNFLHSLTLHYTAGSPGSPVGLLQGCLAVISAHVGTFS